MASVARGVLPVCACAGFSLAPRVPAKVHIIPIS